MYSENMIIKIGYYFNLWKQNVKKIRCNRGIRYDVWCLQQEEQEILN